LSCSWGGAAEDCWASKGAAAEAQTENRTARRTLALLIEWAGMEGLSSRTGKKKARRWAGFGW
ncbi:MAG: hypothetical protein LC627_02985, partial [Verrucomicrobiaceae bacterium]|nr:hypothetical protein [Verrucomicrobiaceae bacterium]